MKSLVYDLLPFLELVFKRFLFFAVVAVNPCFFFLVLVSSSTGVFFADLARCINKVWGRLRGCYLVGVTLFVALDLFVLLTILRLLSGSPFNRR